MAIVTKALKQQPCDDTISRKRVLKAIEKLHVYGFATIDEDKLIETINKLPPVTLKSKSEYEHDHEVVKAYNDGQVFILSKIRAEIEQLPTNTRTNWDGCCPDINYPEIEYVDVSKKQLLEIIDKYRAESEEE